MQDKFEAIREKAHRELDGLLHKLDTVYTPSKAERRALKTSEAKRMDVGGTEIMDLKTRHKLQEEELRKKAEENQD